ncbi:MAG: DUF354 domain-containing protein [Chitinispirillaceae bacterium]|nr:DUF354 domain-containing protein [Chitinispirillaceae bacterium]
MKLLFIINTPAQAYTWKNIATGLAEKGHTIKILARDYGGTIDLVDSIGYQYDVFQPNGARLLRFLNSFKHLYQCYRLARNFNPDAIIGFGVDAAITSAKLGARCIVFNDSEGLPIQEVITRLFADVILTPDCFTEDLGKKHIRVRGYKELAYLHPNYFNPDPSVLTELGVSENEKYVIVRLNSFDAVHDIGEHGFSTTNQIELVKRLSDYARVFISPEASLAEELRKYIIPIPYNRIHHALFYAQLLVTDTQTMTTESALLGTPVVRSNTFVDHKRLGNFLELEKKYELVYSFFKASQAIEKSIELISQPDLKAQYEIKRRKLFSDKIDLTYFMVNFIDSYVKKADRN